MLTLSGSASTTTNSTVGSSITIDVKKYKQMVIKVNSYRAYGQPYYNLDGGSTVYISNTAGTTVTVDISSANSVKVSLGLNTHQSDVPSSSGNVSITLS